MDRCPVDILEVDQESFLVDKIKIHEGCRQIAALNTK